MSGAADGQGVRPMCGAVAGRSIARDMAPRDRGAPGRLRPATYDKEWDQ